MEDILEEELFVIGRNTERIPDSHLQAPIRNVYRKFIFSNPSKWPPFLTHCLSTFPIARHLVDISSEKTYGYLLSAVYQSNDSHRLQWVYDNYPDCTYAVSRFLETICKELGLTDIRTRTDPSERDMMLISQKVRWDEVRSEMQDKRLTKEKWTDISSAPFGISKMKICSQYALFSTIQEPEKWYVFDYDQVMMISDTIAGRVFTLIYNDILPPEIPGKLPHGLIEKLYKVYDNLLTTQGNNAYSFVARWEPICMAVLLKKYDQLQRSISYFDWLVKSVSDDNDSASRDILEILLAEDISVEGLAELHGLYRHWGHPTVHEELGCEKVRSIAQCRPIPDTTILLKMNGALKRQFVSSFVNKHGRWPRVENLSSFKGKPIHDLIATQSVILNLHSPEYSLEDWGLIRFGKEFEFDYHPDYTDLLEDRSISVKRSEIRSIYSSDALGYKPKRPTTDRRVLKEALKRSSVDIHSICDKVQTDTIPKEWKIIIVHAKEREMKIAPRLFAMMTFEMRLYFSATEANIKDKIFPYFPQQTMTLDEADLSKRLLTLTSYSDSRIKMLSALLGIDFSSWNICWTFLSTYLTFQFIDDLFGTPGLMFSTHLFFEQSLVALASHHNPPTSLIHSPTGDPKECNELWYNHRGGFEGLRQKGWTLCTIGLLLLVEAFTGLKSYIIGQGDNQVCKLMVPIPDNYESLEAYICSDQEEISKKIDKFVMTLQSYASKIGLHVKMDETWVGMDVLAYGKEILYKGAFMPQGLKRISRLLTDVNEIYPTLHTKISTLQTSGMSCSQKSYDIITPYYLSTVEVLMVILRDIYRLYCIRGITREDFETSKSITFKQFILCLSSDVGSCPVLSFISFLYRGHPDPLTTYTTWLRLLGTKHPIASRMYTWLSNRCYSLGRGDSELLVSNPCSLNIEAPETISTKLRRDLERSLISYTKNRDLKEIFSSASQKRDKELFDYLLSTQPCHPRISHEIFRNTVTGTKLSFISKFSNTRTTQAIFGETKTSQSMMSTVKILERQLINHWLKMYDGVKNLPQNLEIIGCPSQLAQMLRNDTWSKSLNNSVIEGVTIPHPLHQFGFFSSKKYEDHHMISQPKILYMIPTKDNKHLVQTRGPYPAYVGSSTREKRTGKMYTIPQASRPLKSAERLIQLRNWVCSPYSSMYDFLTTIAQSRTNLPVQVLEDITSPIIGGSVTHRLDDHVTKRSTLHNFRPNITTHIYYSTDTMGRFSQGAQNYNLHFQGAIHLGMSSIQLISIHDPENRSPHHSLVYKAECCEEILHDFALNTSNKPPKLPVSESNPLLFARVGNIPKTFSPSEEGIVKFMKSSRPAEAIGFILFARCLNTGSSFQIGITEKTNPLVGSVGIAEILGAGLHDILYHLSKYLMLYFPLQKEVVREFFHSLPSNCFNDIATICLLPQLLPELSSMAGFGAVPEMFCNKESVSSMIKRVLESFLNDFHNDPKMCISEAGITVYYPTVQVGMRRILSMWRKQIWIATAGEIDIEDVIDELYDVVPPSDYLPNAQFIQEAVSKIILSSSHHILRDVCRSCPLRISNIPAQAIAREARCLPKLKSFQKVTGTRLLKSQTLTVTGYSEPYVKTICCELQIVEPEISELTVMRSLTVKVDKTRLDQTYRIFGNISTAFLKIYEILEVEKIQPKGIVITLAEGEGSIADLLLRLGASYIYYNTLVDRSRLVEQRAPGLVPACVAHSPERVRMGDLTSLTGGDLCDPQVLSSILSLIPDTDVSIVTCDAETSGNFDPASANKILLAWMAVCVKSKTTYGIFKSFCHNADIMTNVSSAAKLIFKEVKVVVPCYSSHETYEVYMVCSSPINIITLDAIISCHIDNLVLRSSSSEGLAISFQKFRRDRIDDHPFQDDKISMVTEMWKKCEELGFEDNSISNLHRLTLFNMVYDGTAILDWLDRIQETVYKRALRVTSAQSASYYGVVVDITHPIYLPKHHILHNQLEAYIVCLMNARILKSIIGCDREDIHVIIKDIISEEHQLKVGEEILYKYTVDPQVWKRAYLKNTCRFWGHWRFNHAHKCCINW